MLGIKSGRVKLPDGNGGKLVGVDAREVASS